MSTAGHMPPPENATSLDGAQPASSGFPRPYQSSVHLVGPFYMQHQISQQTDQQMSQLGQPQQQQQVMLCPVRLVYETQILVQPGEQIQPNQTFIINPQNPPPWIQNQARPQNQLIYMHQMPGNLVPSAPQHMDQNQMYLQNLQGYYPQQMIQMDPRQMPNVVQMMPNINNIGQITGQNVNIGQTVMNVGQNVNSINQNLINTGQNVMSMSNVVQNVQNPANVGVNIVQNQTNTANVVSNDRVYNNTSTMTSANGIQNQNTIANATQMQERSLNMNQNLVNMQRVAELQGMRQQNVVRQPQVTLSPMQNVRYVSNTVDIRPTAPQVGEIRVNSPRPSTSNIPNNVMQANALNKKVPLQIRPNPSVMTNTVRHYNQAHYRHIQPKPMPIQNQYLPNVGTVSNVGDIRPVNSPRPSTSNMSNNVMGSHNIIAPRPNLIINDGNRKRKSESPDETRKKVPNLANNTMTIETENGTIITYTPTPVRDFKLERSDVVTTPVATQTNFRNEKPQVIDMKVIPPSKDVQIESDKLVRNTVFTQARGLLRTEPQTAQPDVIIRIEKQSPTKAKTEIPMTIETSEANAEIVNMVTPKPNTDKVKIEASRPNLELVKLENTTSVSDPMIREPTPPPSLLSFVLSTDFNSKIPSLELVKRETPNQIAKVQQFENSKTTILKQQTNKQSAETVIKAEASKIETVTNAKTSKMETVTKVESLKIETVTKIESLKMETVTKAEPSKMETVTKAEPPKMEISTKTEPKPKEVTKPEVKGKKEKPKASRFSERKSKSEATKPELNEKPVKVETTEVKEINRKFTVTSINDFKGNELQIADGSVRKEDTDHYILTHVLDGYVIQESNTAFPIRKPLKEKIIYQNADMSIEPKKEETYKHRTEDGKLIKDNSKILSISDLNLNEETDKKEDETIKSEETNKCKEETMESQENKQKCDEDSSEPFAKVTASTIKSWTVDQLASYLSKFDWAETISVLSEHEIDGESLFLVNKQQLVQIGVNETHADVICEFIKNS